MPASEAQILANRLNAARSTGPKTPEGKERSRANGLKHGLTGSGVVVPEGDVDEVERVAEALQLEFDPKTVIGAILVRQLATLSVRMDRGAKQESAALATRVRHAADEFDEARLDDAERLFEGLGEDPRGNLRKLRKSPEGVHRLILAWDELYADLTRVPKPVWTAVHLEKAVNLTGMKIDDASGSRLKALSMAAWGDFGALAEGEGGDLDDDARKVWARGQLAHFMVVQVAALEDHYETLDFETIERDRAEAADRALFDPSREATLARRYEAESSRGFFKALKELRKVEAEALDRPAPAPAPPLASSRPALPPTLRQSWPATVEGSSKPVSPPLTPVPTSDEPVRGPIDQPAKSGQAHFEPA